MRAPLHYTGDCLLDSCNRIRARRRALVQTAADDESGAFLHFSVGGSVQIPSEHLPFACEIVACYHNILADVPESETEDVSETSELSSEGAEDDALQ